MAAAHHRLARRSTSCCLVLLLGGSLEAMGVTLSRSPHTPPALLRRSAGVVRSPIVASDLVFSTNIYPSSGRLDGRSEMRYRSEDWLMNLLSLPRSLVLRRVSSHLAASLLSCAAVLAGRSAGLRLQLPPLPHTLLGSFLGLLLVFRTNSAYGRFWEARMIWGSVMNSARNLAQAIVVYVRPLSEPRAARLLELLAAFPHALAHRCLNGRPPLDERVSAAVGEPAALPNVPSAACFEMRALLAASAAELGASTELARSLDTRLQLVEMGRLVDALVNALGGCERILRTPIPLSYSRHTSRALSLWCGTLPLVLAPLLGWAALPAMAVLCWTLFGIEEIGHLIEQPFLEMQSRAGSDSELTLTFAPTEPQRARKSTRAAVSLYGYGLPVEQLAQVISAEVDSISAAELPRADGGAAGSRR